MKRRFVRGREQSVTRSIEGAKSRVAHLEKLSLNFSSSSFVIRVNLLHPCFFVVYYYLFGVFLP